MTGPDDATDRAAAKVTQLAAAVTALSADTVSLSGDLDRVLARRPEVTALVGEIAKVDRYAKRTRTIVRIAVAGLLFDILLTVGFTALSLNQRTFDQNLCHATQRSWDYRKAQIDITTAHTVLSPEAAKLFPASQTASLRIQIAASNATKDAQRVKLVRLNGPRPGC